MESTLEIIKHTPRKIEGFEQQFIYYGDEVFIEVLNFDKTVINLDGLLGFEESKKYKNNIYRIGEPKYLRLQFIENYREKDYQLYAFSYNELKCLITQKGVPNLHPYSNSSLTALHPFIDKYMAEFKPEVIV